MKFFLFLSLFSDLQSVVCLVIGEVMACLAIDIDHFLPYAFEPAWNGACSRCTFVSETSLCEELTQSILPLSSAMHACKSSDMLARRAELSEIPALWPALASTLASCFYVQISK